jgi:hypothetical protein
MVDCPDGTGILPLVAFAVLALATVIILVVIVKELP